MSSATGGTGIALYRAGKEDALRLSFTITGARLSSANLFRHLRRSEVKVEVEAKVEIEVGLEVRRDRPGLMSED